MQKIKIGICENEKIWIEQIEEYLLRYSSNYQKEIEIKIFYSAEDYLQKNENIDILLLDIEMNKISGIDLKNLLVHRVSEESIIFISSYNEFIHEAFGKNVYGFLNKPILEEKLYEKLNVIIENKESSVEILLDNNTFILSSDIIYVKAIDKYVKIFTKKGEKTGYFSLKECEQKLSPFYFKRIHKSFIVNYEHIAQIKNFVEMDNGFIINISRGMVKEIKAEYLNYVRKRARS